MIIRDSVHGDIFFGEKVSKKNLSPSLEKEVIETGLMQRLRGIKQLGATYLVYPGATHTRFEHSLGTSHLAKRIVDNIHRNCFTIDENIREAISVAGLLHDVSHVPFGHTFEDERGIFRKHDSRIGDFLEEGERRDVIELVEVLEQKPGLKEEVTRILNEDKNPNMLWLRQVIKGTIGADLLDYLRRDAYYCGLSLSYDDRIFSYFKVNDLGELYLDLMKHDMNRADARSEVLRVLRARFFLTERVYYHHTKLVAGSMISKAVEIAKEGCGLKEEDLYDHSDTTFMQHLLSYDDDTITTLINGVKKRKLLKRAYVISSISTNIRDEKRREALEHDERITKNRMETEKGIIEKFNKGSKDELTDADLIIYMTPDLSKEADINVKFSGKIQLLGDGDLLSQPVDVKDVQDSYKRIWKLYVFAPGKFGKRVGGICESEFDLENQYKPQNYRYIKTLDKYLRS